MINLNLRKGVLGVITIGVLAGSLSACNGQVVYPTYSFRTAYVDEYQQSNYDEILANFDSYTSVSGEVVNYGIVDGALRTEQELEISETLHNYNLSNWVSDTEEARVTVELSDGAYKLTQEELDECYELMELLPESKKEFRKLVESGDIPSKAVYSLYRYERLVNEDLLKRGYYYSYRVALDTFKIKFAEIIGEDIDPKSVTLEACYASSDPETPSNYRVTYKDNGLSTTVSLKSGNPLYELASLIYQNQSQDTKSESKSSNGEYNKNRNEFIRSALEITGGYISTNGNDNYTYTVARQKHGNIDVKGKSNE